MLIVGLVIAAGFYWLGFHFGGKSARESFTRTGWMHDASETQKRNFIAGRPAGPP